VIPPGYDKRQPGPKSADEYTSSTPGIDPADPYTLLGQHYHGELPRWGGRDYRDPTLIAGRPRSSYRYFVVLLVAAGADIGAFFQIVELVLPTASETLVYVVVLGFTATALSLAHKGGALFRDHMAGAAWAGKVIPFLCVMAWLLLGIAAFYVRLTGLSSINGSLSLSLASPQTGSSSHFAYDSAIIFLALYLGTGLVAWMGAYFSRNPLAESYQMASRAFFKARYRADLSSSRADSAELILSFMRAELATAEKTLEHEIQSRLALAEKLRLVAHAARTPETEA
jgi:hypothetical protein